ncbi:hypothetical protein [Arthrobacter sp. FW306-06-A]|uniref:hypothetical protein n=1 Tax=Arthrobacter sp. FW306-06-A TaxID=2879621 RepID=UPI001F2DE2A0|nr:hypothetical protein [Arthrobacter sp. FW306-06-A]UKA69578.1 hypothetical protein LFT49_12425 [Arthrobacter sp. FW306-06-A]
MSTVHILGEGGGVFELSLPLHETIADKLAKGHLRRVQPDGTPYVEGDRPEGVPNLPESRPALNAVKAEWVGWAVVQGLKPDEAEGLTKADLVERFGAGQETPEGDGSEGEVPEGSTPEGAPAE